MFGDALQEVDQKIYHTELLPRHGSGATADGLIGNQKWAFKTWHSRLETLFPYGDYAIPNPRWAWKYRQIRFLDPEDEPPTKVVLVPKTQTTPRVIAEEPVCMQYIQQAIMRELVHQLELNESGWFVGFTEQWPNQALAQIGSEDGSLATLDLSEASDRVANWVVEDLFSDFPWFLEGIEACRSTHARLPSGEVIPLQKFASMGSALTFPIEAMVFSAIVIEGVLRAAGLPISRKNIRSLRDTVRVYGDDIIVPTHYAESVILDLETFGFKVNKNKSFWTGGFRESCGKEYWNGLDVSIIKFRKKLPTSRRDVEEIVSTVSTRNQFFSAGMWKTAALLDDVLERTLRFYPYVHETSPVLGRLHPDGRYDITHWSNDGTNRPLVKGWIVSSKIPANWIDEEDALLKCLVEYIGMPNADNKHLTRSGRPRVASIQLGKASPF